MEMMRFSGLGVYWVFLYLLLRVGYVAGLPSLSSSMLQHDSVSMHIGVPPAKIAFYEKQTIRCDADILLKQNHINDNYCDCPESGLDEPGTSACQNGRFYCANKGYQSLTIRSSRVNDGICDCCDGSDEYESTSVCKDVCDQMAKEAAQELLDRKQKLESGLQHRSDLVEKARLFREEQKNLLLKYEQELKNIQASLEKATQIRTEAEEKEEEERRILEKKEKKEAENIAQEQAVNTENEPSSPEASETQPTQEESSAEQAESSQVEPETESKEAEATAETSFPYPKEYAVPDKIPESHESDGDKSSFFDALDSLPEPEENPEPYDEDTYYEELEFADEPAHSEYKENADLPEERVDEEESEIVKAMRDWASGFSEFIFGYWKNLFFYKHTVKSAAAQARSDVSEIENKISKIEDKLRDINSLLEITYGDDDVYLPLRNECFDLVVKQYTYQLCPFVKAVQKEGSNTVSMGDFTGWEEGTPVWTFENGLRCWNGPARSVRVFVDCATESVLMSVSEPSTCTYEMHFGTPAACTHNDVEKLQQEINNIFQNTDQQPAQESRERDEL